MAEIEDELKSLWWGWKRKMKKAKLKLSWKNKIMASSSITSQQREGGKWNQGQVFFSWALKRLACCSPWGHKESNTTKWLNWTKLKITVDSDSSHEIKRSLLLRRKAMTNLDSALKSRDITLLTKVSIVQAMVFPVVMFRCDHTKG